MQLKLVETECILPELGQLYFHLMLNNMNLIQILVHQLRGEVDFFNDGGAVCKIQF
jgi:hypothetical protein